MSKARDKALRYPITRDQWHRYFKSMPRDWLEDILSNPEQKLSAMQREVIQELLGHED